MGAPRRNHTPDDTPRRRYLVGMPVVITVYEDGRVHYWVDTSEGSMSIDKAPEWPEGVTWDQVREDIARVDADHEKRRALLDE